LAHFMVSRESTCKNTLVSSVIGSIAGKWKKKYLIGC
jgi:hypothetical protein